jgi:hypothetical protein
MALGPGVVGLSQVFATPGQIGPGETWHFQTWFRDPSGPCSNGSNTSNAVRMMFTAVTRASAASRGVPTGTQARARSSPGARPAPLSTALRPRAMIPTAARAPRRHAPDESPPQHRAHHARGRGAVSGTPALAPAAR